MGVLLSLLSSWFLSKIELYQKALNTYEWIELKQDIWISNEKFITIVVKWVKLTLDIADWL